MLQDQLRWNRVVYAEISCCDEELLNVSDPYTTIDVLSVRVNSVLSLHHLWFNLSVFVSWLLSLSGKV